MRLNHNMFSLSAYKTYSKSTTQNATALERISTGSILNSAKDNPKKIGQSSQLRMQLKSLESASKNIQDSISMLQTAEGGLNEASSMLQRMRKLTVAAGDGAMAQDDRQKIQDEIEELKAGINDIAKNTTFNGVKMIGADVQGTYNNNNNPIQVETMIGFLSNEKMDISYYNVSCDYLVDKNGMSLSDVTVFNEQDLENAFSIIDNAIDTIAKIRSEYGAQSQRLESSSDHISANSILISSTQSSIFDTDLAAEIMEYSRTDILRQASISVIAQTNQIPMNALQVLNNSR